MERPGRDVSQRESHCASGQGQHAALDQMLTEQPGSLRAQRQAHGRLALPADRARQQEVGHVRADDQQQHAHQQQQDPQRVGVPGVQRTEAAVARQRHELGTLRRAPGRHHAAERAGDLCSGGRLGNPRLQPAHLTDPPVPIVLAARRVGALRQLEWHFHRERGVEVGPLAASHAVEPRRSDADNPGRHVVDADRALERVVAAAKPVHPEAMADDHHRFLIQAIFLVAERASERGHDAQSLKKVRADILHAPLRGGKRVCGNRHVVRVGADADELLEHRLLTRKAPIQIRRDRRALMQATGDGRVFTVVVGDE